MDTDNGKRLGRQKEASQRWSIPEATLEKWRVRGGGPPFIKIGRSIRYDFAVGDRWFTDRQRQSTSDVGRAA